ncbi:RHS repeat-associated core domain-containing protein [Ekhidna sp. To15]|uniref:RHS repeat-associated core domain-containing protein n=1 Tax=Ekhidna sp. To15 TaxID=3395267 RepID=UPI003F522590
MPSDPPQLMYQSGYASYDSLTGYYDFLFRSYDPELGRFFAFDPMAASTPSYSPYHANFNNPISFTDPFGLSPSDYRLKDFGGNENANDGMYTGDFGPGMLGSGGLGNINALAGPDAVYGQANWAIQNGFWDAIPDGYYVNDGGGNFERVSNKRRVKIYVVETGSGVYWTPFRENFEGIDGILRVDQDWITGKQAEELLQANGGNQYETGTYTDTYYSTYGFPHLSILQGAFRVDAVYGVYKDLEGKPHLKFGGTLNYYSQALGESRFVAQTQLLVDGKAVGPVQTAGFGPGESMFINPGDVALGFTNVALPEYGRNVQLQLTINAYFKDGQHPGVDITRRHFTFNVPYISVPTIGPK